MTLPRIPAIANAPSEGVVVDVASRWQGVMVDVASGKQGVVDAPAKVGQGVVVIVDAGTQGVVLGHGVVVSVYRD